MDAEGRLQGWRIKTILRKMNTVIRSKPRSYSCAENTTCMFGIRSSEHLPWHVFQAGTLCSGPFRSKPSIRLVSTRMKLQCRMNKSTNSEQETRTRKIICWLLQTWQRRLWCWLQIKPGISGVRNQKAKNFTEGKFTKIKMQKLVMPFSASSTIKKKK